MKTISAQEWELLSLFEAESEFSRIDDVWPLTNAEYFVEQGQVQLYCWIHPVKRSFRLRLCVSDSIVYKLNVAEAKDIRYCGSPGNEWLEVIITGAEIIQLRVKPEIEIEHDCNAIDYVYPDFLYWREVWR